MALKGWCETFQATQEVQPRNVGKNSHNRTVDRLDNTIRILMVDVIAHAVVSNSIISLCCLSRIICFFVTDIGCPCQLLPRKYGNICFVDINDIIL